MYFFIDAFPLPLQKKEEIRVNFVTSAKNVKRITSSIVEEKNFLNLSGYEHFHQLNFLAFSATLQHLRVCCAYTSMNSGLLIILILFLLLRNRKYLVARSVAKSSRDR